MRTMGGAPALRASEKSLLHLLRLRGALSKAELARLSNMSAQGVSIIIERLFDLALVKKGQKKRGRVGQPSTPIILNPEGAVSMGIFIGMNKAQLVAADFRGAIRAERSVTYANARDLSAAQSIIEAASALSDTLGDSLWSRRIGIGIAARECLLDTLSGTHAHAPGLADPDCLAQRLEKKFQVPAYCVNDIRAACITEIAAGMEYANHSTLYLDIGRSFGAGIILEGRLIGTEEQVSSSLHTLPMPERKNTYVGDLASLESLRQSLEQSDSDYDTQLVADFVDTQDAFALWRDEAAQALAAAIRAASATLIIDRVLIASDLRHGALRDLVRELQHRLETDAHSRIRLPTISMETVTPNPRAQGAAMVPFLKAFGMPEG